MSGAKVVNGDALVDALHEHLIHERGDLFQAAQAHLKRIAPLLAPTDSQVVLSRTLATITGLGPLDELLADNEVREVMVNADCDVWVERCGELRKVTTLRQGEVKTIIERILMPLGRHIDRMSPIVDARLSDGSRVCAVISPIGVDGSYLSIRRFSVRHVAPEAFGPPSTVKVLSELVRQRCNTLVIGAASSGKTTLLNAMCSLIRATERIVTIEDVAELRLQAPHVVRLEARPAGSESLPAISMSDLLHTALRLRPDRLIVGEVRGAEAIDMLMAMNTGHHGSLASCHANNPVDALHRLEALVLQHHPHWPIETLRQHIHLAIDVIVHVQRRRDGSRFIRDITEVSEHPHGSPRSLLFSDHCELRRGRLE
ncbi:MAG: ATPase, T2SS/T4P/T4SS family [Ilumatobacteraceae bacterium]